MTDEILSGVGVSEEVEPSEVVKQKAESATAVEPNEVSPETFRKRKERARKKAERENYFRGCLTKPEYTLTAVENKIRAILTVDSNDISGAVKLFNKNRKKEGNKRAQIERLLKGQAESPNAKAIKVKPAPDVDPDAFNSTSEPSQAEAKTILFEDRGLRNSVVVDVVYDQLVLAAQYKKITPNKFLFRHGIAATLKSLQNNAPTLVEMEQDAETPGLLTVQQDTYALWDAMYGWLDAPEYLTFEQFKSERLRTISDPFYLGKEYLDRDFHEIHQEWMNFFPQFDVVNNYLRPNFSQGDMKRVLGATSADVKRRLLLASRNMYKSSTIAVWLISAILFTGGNLRALLCTETKSLSSKQVKFFRTFFEIKNPRQLTKFQRLWIEFCIPAGQGVQTSYRCPFRHLDLLQDCVEFTSYESGGSAGSRCDVCIHDDVLSLSTVGTDAACEKTITIYNALQKLLEVGSLGSITLGTPWKKDLDLYAYLLKQNESDPEHSLAFRIDPVFKVKSEFVDIKDLRELTENQIVLTFPSRLDWKYCRQEMKEYAGFLSQNILIWPDDDSDQKITFDEDLLRSRQRPASWFPHNQTETILAVDQAFSVARYADFTALASARCFRNADTNDRWALQVVDVPMVKLKDSERAIEIVRAASNNNVSKIIIEKSPNWELFHNELKLKATIMGVTLPYVEWRDADTKPGAKALRVKKLEILLADKRLWFTAHGDYLTNLVPQFVNFTGLRRSASTISQKDDGVDSVAMAVQAFYRLLLDVDFKTAEAVAKEEKEAEQEAAAALRRLTYQAVFGDTPGQRLPAQIKSEERPVRNYFHFPVFTRKIG